MRGYLRRTFADIATGFRASVDLLLWGHVYPRPDPELTAKLAAEIIARRKG